MQFLLIICKTLSLIRKSNIQIINEFKLFKQTFEYIIIIQII